MVSDKCPITAAYRKVKYKRAPSDQTSFKNFAMIQK